MAVCWLPQWATLAFYTECHTCLVFLFQTQRTMTLRSLLRALRSMPSLPLSLHQPPHWMDCLPVQHALLHRLHGPGNRHVCTNSLSHTLITPSAPVELLSTSRMSTVRAEEKVLSGSWLMKDEFRGKCLHPAQLEDTMGPVLDQIQQIRTI